EVGDSEAQPGYSFELSALQPRVDARGITLMLKRGLSPSELPSLIQDARRNRLEGSRDWLFAALDDEKLPPALIVRPRLRGERGQVLHHAKTIKLKKLMIDHKIPASRRAFWPVVSTPDGRYVWSPGLPPAVDFAARDETRVLAVVHARNL